ncbi:haloacid dehalogenase-like hydrolase [Omnitrophica bacterium]|nr:haloacid dehalogenase-like hydrolase [Candidatus Omnitrophota bacterium]
MIKAIIFDWNGTLTSDLFELRFFQGFLKWLLKKHSLNFFLWMRVLRLNAIAKLMAGKRLADGKNARHRLRNLLEYFNSAVKNYVHEEDLVDYTNEYAKNRSSLCIDEKLLKLINQLHFKYKTMIGIISSGYFLNIKMSMAAHGVHVDFIKANDFCRLPSGKLYYDWAILDNKDAVLRGVLSEKGLKMDDVAYIGDDLNDLGCFKIIGYPVMSPAADPIVKEQLSQKCNLFCPHDDDELCRYLEQHINRDG